MTSSAQIEREIEETRARLDLTMDQLQQHASLAALAEDALGYLHDKGAAAWGYRLANTARANPIPAAMAVLGAGWLFRQLSKRSYVADQMSVGAVGRNGRNPLRRETRRAEPEAPARRSSQYSGHTAFRDAEKRMEHPLPAQR